MVRATRWPGMTARVMSRAMADGATGDADAGESGQDGNQPADVPRDPLGRPTRDGTSGRADGGDSACSRPDGTGADARDPDGVAAA